jgi:small subunit ribosomal protein S21
MTHATHANMNAFVPTASFSATRASMPAQSARCPAFASASCFLGAPVARRVVMPNIAAPATAGAGSLRMDVTIVVGDSEPIESALRRFKKDVTKSGHLFELRRRRYFETATEKRIRKAAASKRKARMTRTQNDKNRRNMTA